MQDYSIFSLPNALLAGADGDFPAPAWNTGAPSGYTMAAAVGPGGSRATEFAFTANSSVSQYVPASAGKYSASIWLKGSGAVGWKIFPNSGGPFAIIEPIQLKSDWTRYSLSLALQTDDAIGFVFYPVVLPTTVQVWSPALSQPGGMSAYLAKFTSQYQQSPNMISWAAANLKPFQDIASCLAGFGPAFDLDSAVGAQLDVLGTIIGQARTVAFQPTGGVSPVLNDPNYRILLRARIAQNHWDGKMDSLLRIWQAIFPGGVLIVNDHQDMTVDLYVAAPLNSILKDLILNGYIIPKPQAVHYNISLAVLPMLGFDRGDAFVAGVDVGHFV
jgi:hypothetical protein